MKNAIRWFEQAADETPADTWRRVLARAKKLKRPVKWRRPRDDIAQKTGIVSELGIEGDWSDREAKPPWLYRAVGISKKARTRTCPAH